MSELRILNVSDDDDGQRLDRWLKKNVPEMPYVLAQKLARKGQIRIDGKRAKPDTRLVAGQQVKIPPFDAAAPQEGGRPPQKRKLSEADADFIRSLVIFDDGEVMALNKPGGLAVQGGTNTKRHIDGMLEALKNEEGVTPRLVHRLDKDTSGVLLLARSAKVARELGAAFKGRDIRKIYWAVLTPPPESPAGTIKAPVVKAGGPQKEKMVIDEEQGKFAITEYAVLETAFGAAAFTAFWPRTGRTHQLRVHAQLMGCTIIGDHKYKAERDPESKKIEADLAGLEIAKRLHLHARRMTLKHPTRKGTLDITAPLPPELVKSWRALGFNPKDKSDPFEDLR